MNRRSAAYYPMARTAHLERLRDSRADVLLYTWHRADWDLRVLDDFTAAIRTNSFGVARQIFDGSLDVLEIPEPLAVRLLPELFLLAATIRVTPRRRRPVVSTYAIENLDQVGKLASVVKSRMVAQFVFRAALASVLPMIDKIAFGTDGARATYEYNVGPWLWKRFSRSTSIESFPALPQAEAGVKPVGDPLTVVFVGTFEERKGFWALIRTWDQVRAAVPGVRLRVIGKGTAEDEERVLAWAIGREDVSVHINPPRAQIHGTLDASSVLVLASRRTPTWREQVGLPIVEALGHGLTIVTSRETGIADWLEGAGHFVVGSEFSDEELAGAIVRAVVAPVPRAEVLDSLPSVDQRRAADQWMFARDAER